MPHRDLSNELILQRYGAGINRTCILKRLLAYPQNWQWRAKVVEKFAKKRSVQLNAGTF